MVQKLIRAGTGKVKQERNRAARHAPRAPGAPRESASIFPVILAAGRARELGFPQALARFEGRTALEIAAENCVEAGLGAPIVVLGHGAARVRAAAPRGARVVVHRGWREGQLSSLRAGLRHVPRNAAFLLYPVDYPLLTPKLIRRLVRACRRRPPAQVIIVPTCHGRAGHPVIFCSAVRGELARADTARDVIEKDPGRVRRIAVGSPHIWTDFDTPAEYRKCRRILAQRRARR